MTECTFISYESVCLNLFIIVCLLESFVCLADLKLVSWNQRLFASAICICLSVCLHVSLSVCLSIYNVSATISTIALGNYAFLLL